MIAKRAERAENTRAELVRVAHDLFAERGYDATPIEEVLRRAGVSKGALYHHFPTKEALFEAVFEENERAVMDRVMAASKGSTDPLELLLTGSLAWLDVTMDPAVRRISFIDGPAVLGWQRWRDLDEKYGFGVVKRLLQQAVAMGRIPDQNVDLLAHILLAALGESAMVIARAEDPKGARAAAGETVEHLIEGMARSPS